MIFSHTSLTFVEERELVVPSFVVPSIAVGLEKSNTAYDSN